MKDRSERNVPSEAPGANISTGNQPEGAARRPSDTLDREPKRDPGRGAPIPDDYDPKRAALPRP
jgi:hypothetical protein